jgi:hypothetical protein
MYNVQDYSVLYHNAVLPVLDEGWHFTPMWQTLGPLHNFTKSGGLAQQNILIEVPVPSQERGLSCNCVRGVGIDFVCLFLRF